MNTPHALPDGGAMTNPMVVLFAVLLSSPALLDAVEGTLPVPSALIRLLLALIACATVLRVCRWWLSTQPHVIEAMAGRTPTVDVAEDVDGSTPPGPQTPPGVRGDGPPRRKNDERGRRGTDIPQQRRADSATGVR